MTEEKRYIELFNKEGVKVDVKMFEIDDESLLDSYEEELSDSSECEEPWFAPVIYYYHYGWSLEDIRRVYGMKGVQRALNYKK